MCSSSGRTKRLKTGCETLTNAVATSANPTVHVQGNFEVGWNQSAMGRIRNGFVTDSGFVSLPVFRPVCVRQGLVRIVKHGPLQTGRGS